MVSKLLRAALSGEVGKGDGRSDGVAGFSAIYLVWPTLVTNQQIDQLLGLDGL